MEWLSLMWRRASEACVPLLGSRYRAFLSIVRSAVPLALVGYLAYQLSRIGWLTVWDARPVAPAFYLVLFLPFFVQPFSDLIIYRLLLGRRSQLSITLFLRKRYLNNVMLDYAGEAYFLVQAQQRLGLERSALLYAVRDSNVLSAGAGLAIVWLVLLALGASGGLKLPAFLSNNFWQIGAVGSLPLVPCAVLVIGGRRITSLRSGQIAMTFFAHLARGLVVLALEFALWRLSGALPTAVTCLEFVGLRLLVTRLPLLPRKDLLFVGLGMAAASVIGVPEPRVTAALVIITGFDQLLEFGLVGLPWLFQPVKARIGIKQPAP